MHESFAAAFAIVDLLLVRVHDELADRENATLIFQRFRRCRSCVLKHADHLCLMTSAKKKKCDNILSLYTQHADIWDIVPSFAKLRRYGLHTRDLIDAYATYQIWGNVNGQRHASLTDRLQYHFVGSITSRVTCLAFCCAVSYSYGLNEDLLKKIFDYAREPQVGYALIAYGYKEREQPVRLYRFSAQLKSPDEDRILRNMVVCVQQSVHNMRSGLHKWATALDIMMDSLVTLHHRRLLHKAWRNYGGDCTSCVNGRLRVCAGVRIAKKERCVCGLRTLLSRRSELVQASAEMQHCQYERYAYY